LFGLVSTNLALRKDSARMAYFLHLNGIIHSNAIGMPMKHSDAPAKSVAHLSRVGTQLGFHYFPDTVHYSLHDLQTWLPLLLRLRVNWLVVTSPTERAIPEYFLTGLIHAGITPIVQFQFSLTDTPPLKDVTPLIEAYAKWEVRHFQIFDRPNLRTSWGTKYWAQRDLVEAFMDRFLPWAQLIVHNDGIPILPPLEPGGDFWDLSFLQQFLTILERRHQHAVTESLHLSAYAWTHKHPLNWGMGGPLAWPEARPYDLNPQSQDHRGFRIFEWYQTIAQATLERTLPIHLYQVGLPAHPKRLLDAKRFEHPAEAEGVYTVYQNLSQASSEADTLGLSPANVASCNFWLLSADPSSPFAPHSWFKDAIPTCEAVDKLTQIRQTLPARGPIGYEPITSVRRPIRHYVLLPKDLLSQPDVLGKLLPTLSPNTAPTIGCSFSEALMADRVTLVAPERFDPEVVDQLRANGCDLHTVTLS